MANPRRTKPVKFPLASQAGRTALILGIYNRKVTREEVEAAVLHDLSRRPRAKPIVAEGRRFPSVTDAAWWIYRNCSSLNSVHKNVKGGEHAAINRIAARIRCWANKDDRMGYYWSE